MTRLNKALAIVSMFCGLAACGPDGGNSAPDTGSAGNAGSAADAGQQLSPEAQAFLGQWTYTSGTESAQCGTDPTDTQPITPGNGTVTFSAGPVSTQLIADDSGCIVPVTVSGNTASGVPGIVCPGNLVLGSLVYTLSSGTLREQGDGQFETATGQVCTVTDDAFLIRN